MAGISGAWWELEEERLDPFMADDGIGGSAFLEISTARVGPITVGYAISDVEGADGAERWFVLVSPERIAWPGPIRSRRAALIP